MKGSHQEPMITIPHAQFQLWTQNNHLYAKYETTLKDLIGENTATQEFTMPTALFQLNPIPLPSAPPLDALVG